MYAVEIWGQERGKKRVSGCPTCGQKKGKQKGKNGIGPRMKNGRANHKQIMTSQLSALASSLSLKKQSHTTHFVSTEWP